MAANADQPLAPREEQALTAQPTPMEILARMSEEGAPPESLQVLADLAWKQEDRNARKEFFSGLKEFKRRCPVIPKSKRITITKKDGTTYEYWFTPLDKATPVFDPILDDLGFHYSWSSDTQGNTMLTKCYLRHEDGHEEVSAFACPIDNPNPGMTQQQKAGGALTFAHRYTLFSALGITTAEDDIDGRGDDSSGDAVKPVTEEQARELETYAVSVGMDQEHWLKWLGAPSIELIPAKHFKKAMAGIKKVDERQKAEGK